MKKIITLLISISLIAIMAGSAMAETCVTCKDGRCSVVDTNNCDQWKQATDDGGDDNDGGDDGGDDDDERPTDDSNDPGDPRSLGSNDGFNIQNGFPAVYRESKGSAVYRESKGSAVNMASKGSAVNMASKGSRV